MTSKMKKYALLGLACVSTVITCVLGIYVTCYQANSESELRTANEKVQAAENINAQLRDDNIVLSQTVDNQKQKIDELQATNDELSQQVEELKNRRSIPVVSRGEYGRTTTLEISAYTAADGLTPSTRMANGETVHVGAAAMNGVPFGTRIYVPELDRVVVVKDRCGYDGILDIYCDTLGECYQIGRRTCEVQILD